MNKIVNKEINKKVNISNRASKLALAVLLIMALLVLTACNGDQEGGSKGNQGGGINPGGVTDADGKLTIVTTIFPEYDWVREILGITPEGGSAAGADDVELIMLLDSGVDLHSFQPTARDILTISTCDMFIYVGGESEAWVADAIKDAANEKMVVLNLLELLGEQAKLEEHVEGMEEDHDHDHDSEEEDHDHDAESEDHDHDHDDEGEDHDHDHGDCANGNAHCEEEAEYDEHVWLSLKNGAFFTEKIAEAIADLDPENAQVYAANAAAYIDKLNALDTEYAKVVTAANGDTLLFGDRFPFRYLTDDYGLKYYAAFAGCSAETEASFETVAFLSQKVDELGLNCIITIDGGDQKLAETIARNTATGDQKILTLNSMQGITSRDIDAGASYIEIMEENLATLKEALS